MYYSKLISHFERYGGGLLIEFWDNSYNYFRLTRLKKETKSTVGLISEDDIFIIDTAIDSKSKINFEILAKKMKAKNIEIKCLKKGFLGGI
ncbi:hypothetical protein [Clostridium sp.]|uniref:hypothetical protein n=1 Tax=Clostridium sp. TaxID=1506 RepID=UPI0039957D4B